MTIEIGRELYFENLISLKVQGSQNEINKEIQSLYSYLQENGIAKVGPVITATFSIKQEANGISLNMEILIPIDKCIESNNKYIFKEKFHLVSAVYLRHDGKPDLLQDSCSKLLSYIHENSLQNITSMYNVLIKEPEIQNGVIGNMIVDLYIGINPSVL